MSEESVKAYHVQLRSIFIFIFTEATCSVQPLGWQPYCGMANPAAPISPYWWSDSDAESQGSLDGGVLLPDVHVESTPIVTAEAVMAFESTDEEREERIQNVLDFFNLMYDTSGNLLSPLRILCLQLLGRSANTELECKEVRLSQSMSPFLIPADTETIDP